MDPSDAKPATATITTLILLVFRSIFVDTEMLASDCSEDPDLVADWMTSDLRPLSIVNDDGFRHLSTSYRSLEFNVPSRTPCSNVKKKILANVSCSDLVHLLTIIIDKLIVKKTTIR